MRADAKSVDGCILLHQALNDVFIDAAAGENGDVLQTAIIENTPHLEGMISQIAAVKPHAFDLDAVPHQIRRETNDLLRSGFRIVSIDQQNCIVRIRTCKMLQRRGFVTRQRTDHDARARTVHLTAPGWRYYNELVPQMKRQEQTLRALLRDGELERLYALLDRFDDFFTAKGGR